jgi:hypothetical protein
MRWRLVLCLWGLSLFGLLTYDSMRVNSMRFNTGASGQQHHNRYFWWGSFRLDSDPLNKRPMAKPCVESSVENCDFELYIWVDPGWIERALILTALPAFFLAIVFVHGLAHLGISELLTFLFTMPLLTLAWFYTLGWLLDRWLHKRALRRASL